MITVEVATRYGNIKEVKDFFEPITVESGYQEKGKCVLCRNVVTEMYQEEHIALHQWIKTII